jgi:hypothetical protein
VRIAGELEGTFIRREIRIDGGEQSEHWVHVDTIAEAHGIMFLCPQCFGEDPPGPVGCHMMICWRPFVPPHVTPKPGRWELVGTGLDDLTLVAGSSSIKITGGCNAHFFVGGGAVSMCSDSGRK